LLLPGLRAALRHPFSPRRRSYLRAALARREYAEWIARYDSLDDRDRQQIAADIARLSSPPRIAVLMPVYNPAVAVLREAIDSVRAQLYPHWELCIADDASPDPAVRETLRACRDPRIRVVERPGQGGISAASNSALEVVQSEWTALLDHDDVLAPHALYMVAAEIDAHPDAAMIFSDEDGIDEEGHRFSPLFKPDWNPELMLGQNAFGHLGVFRTADVRAIGGFRPEVDGSQDWDLALRMADRVGAARIRHIPHVLYHWRQQALRTTPSQFSRRRAPEAATAATRVVQDHLARVGEAAVIGGYPDESWKRISRPLPSPHPRVTVILVARGSARRLARSIRHVLARTDYAALDVLVVAGGRASREFGLAPAGAASDPRVAMLAVPETSNLALLRNRAVEEARSDVVVFLDAEVTPRDPQWLAELVGQAARPAVGAAGGLLLDPRGRVRSAGLLLGVGSVAGPAHAGRRARSGGYFGRARLAQDLSAVSGACLATRRAVFREVGGFDPDLARHFGDVDYCLRLREAGYRVVWTPLARLVQRASRGFSDGKDREHQLMRARWAGILDADPAANPNLSLDAGDFSLAFPPRVRKPWKVLAAAGES
jgi:GT2 family glycosyltransferase